MESNKERANHPARIRIPCEHDRMRLDYSSRSAAICAAMFAALTASGVGQSQQWLVQVGTASYDYAAAAATDGASGTYFAGGTSGDLGGVGAGRFDAWVAHHDGAGTRTWIQQFGTSLDDGVWDVAPDGVGGVFVVGYTEGALGGPHAGGDYDVWLARFDRQGNRAWVIQFGSAENDYAYAASSDGQGGVFVGGRTDGALGGPNAGDYDVWLARFDGAGNQAWIRQFGSYSLDIGSGLAFDGAGGVFVTGGSINAQSGSYTDAWLVLYDGAGQQVWTRQLGSSHYDFGRSVAPDGVGGAFVTGLTFGDVGGPNVGHYDVWIARYDGIGEQAWVRQFGSLRFDDVYSATADGSGGVFISGTTEGSLGGPSSGQRDAWISRFDGAGQRAWLLQFGSLADDVAEALAPDGAGGFTMCGYTEGSFGGPTVGGKDAWLARFDGGLQSQRYCSPANANSTIGPAWMSATGDNMVLANDLVLIASGLPGSAFGFFRMSQMRGFVAGAGGSQGNLCLGGAIGGAVGPGRIMTSGTTGSFALRLDLAAIPTPTGLVPVQPGETWHFQAWYRDLNPMSTSNFTDALSVTFD